LLSPGQTIRPYHFEWTNQEWLIMLDERPTLRSQEGGQELEPGDTACLPAGPGGLAMLSTKNEVGIVEYPDSDKLGVWVNGTNYVLRRSERLDYWNGER
jgi:uncharacterized cupin superfamily protein